MIEDSFLQMISYDNVILRPMRMNDLPDKEKWNTIETEWGDWDAPWEGFEPFDMEKERSKLQKAIDAPPEVYGVMELETDEGWHIGWVSRYYIDDVKYLPAVGIDIPPLEARRRGYGKSAFIIWIAYHFANSDAEYIYTQTWSGNYPMIKLAESVGFEEIGRIKGIRKVRGGRFDALTFSISRKAFNERHARSTKTSL